MALDGNCNRLNPFKASYVSELMKRARATYIDNVCACSTGLLGKNERMNLPTQCYGHNTPLITPLSYNYVYTCSCDSTCLPVHVHISIMIFVAWSLLNSSLLEWMSLLNIFQSHSHQCVPRTPGLELHQVYILFTNCHFLTWSSSRVSSVSSYFLSSFSSSSRFFIK